jgi:hypothetical protein
MVKYSLGNFDIQNMVDDKVARQCSSYMYINTCISICRFRMLKCQGFSLGFLTRTNIVIINFSHIFTNSEKKLACRSSGPKRIDSLVAYSMKICPFCYPSGAHQGFNRRMRDVAVLSCAYNF